MKIFSYLYDRTIFWSGHRHARYYLAGVSFVESCFFPIPPDMMLISMGLATPKKSWYYALIATLFSVAGGILGYYIGMYAITFIEPYLLDSSFANHYINLKEWLSHSSVWLVIFAGFTPFPYKIFTITAGAMHVPMFVFIIGSIIGRGMRFFLVSGILFYAGDTLEKNLRRYVDIIGYALILVSIVGYCIYKWI
ncbi:MAG: DedA family protein [Legionellaceae bacterium]|nr:DedA family protein [Legionellaceae bacterium]